MIDDMKLLKTFEYKNHSIKIYGEYKENKYDYIKFEGNKYNGIIETAHEIYSHDGKQISKKRYTKEEYQSSRLFSLKDMDFIASNKIAIEGRLFKKVKRHITLREDLEEVIQKLEKRCIEIIDDRLEWKEQKEREKIITDGLMNSLDNL